MKLPGGDRAVVDRQRLLTYNLLESHGVGGAKARVLRAALGLTPVDVDALILALHDAAKNGEAVERFTDEYGTRYRLDFVLQFSNKSRTVRSGWLVRTAGAPPEFMSVWVRKANAERI